MDAKQTPTVREQQLKAVWSNTHSDFRGTVDGVKTIMVYRNGSCLVALEDLTEAEIKGRLPKKRESATYRSRVSA